MRQLPCNVLPDQVPNQRSREKKSKQGNLTSSTGSVAHPWRFAAGYFDSGTGLYKFGTRYYNPGFGRWSQQDPLRGHLDDPTSLNRYLYAGDDPVNFTDPSGRDLTRCLLALVEFFGGALLLGAAIIGAVFVPEVGI